MVYSISCNKRMHPAKTSSTASIEYNPDPSPSESKPSKTLRVVKKESRIVYPEIITVVDSAASTSVDGRLYYDVLGHRYWKNYKDGKYYLFNKSMYNDPSFKKPDNTVNKRK